jgi:glutamate-1-semialdehyde 2,1-aminomutase
MMTVFFGRDEVLNFDDAAKANHDLFNAYFHFLLKNGIYLPPSGYETWFISDCIKKEEIDKTLEISREFVLSL